MKKTVKVLIIALCLTLLSLSTLLFASCKCEHEWSEWQIVTAATCESEGVESRKCSKCDNTEIKKIDALGHEEVTDEEIAATCTTTGKTEGKHCSRCSKVLVKQEIVNALGHKWGIWDILIVTACETVGIQKHCCKICNENELEEIAVTGHQNKNGICQLCHKDISTSGLIYSESEENTCVVTAIENTADKNIIIPAEHNGKMVIGIGDGVFWNSEVISVDIPDTVISIGEEAFFGCRMLTSITIPNNVIQISKNAFFNCVSLTSVNIPDSVRSMGEGAFGNCNKLIKVKDNVFYLDGWIVGANTNIKEVVIQDGVRGIGNKAFFWCNELQKITLPDSLKIIGERAFCLCHNLKNVCIPNGVERIGKESFYDSGVVNVTIGNAVKYIENSAFANCKMLKSVIVPYGVVSIGDNAFSHCEELTTINIPNSVKNIGNSVFFIVLNLNL